MPAVAHPPTDNPLDHALALVELGLRPVPIKPGGKHPPMASWQHAQPTADTVRNWWNGLYRNHGVGLVMGPQPSGVYLMAIDIDTHNPAADGWDALHDLEARHGDLPDTWRSITGSGGAHILFASPDAVPVRNQQAGGNRIAPGIDVRGDGGQIVVAPTLHPVTGRPYAWEFAPWDAELATCPGWLLDLVRERVVVEANTSPTHTKPSTQSDSPAELLRQRWDWRHELGAAGWTLTKDGHDSLWTRPGKNPRDGHSAVLHGGDVLVVFTTEIPNTWRQAGVLTSDGSGYSFSPFAFYAATRHQGRMNDAGSALRAEMTAQYAPVATQGPITADLDDEPSYDDELRALLVDWPTFWAVDHNDAEWIAEPIIAAKRSTAIFAPGGTGKSLLSLYLAACLAIGRDPFNKRRHLPPIDVLYLDYEMTNADLAERLEQMGFASEDLSRLHYTLLPSLPGLDQPEGGKAVVRLAEIVGASLVVIDTFGRAVHGDENEADTVRAWYRWTGLHLKHAGRAFIRVDHAGKDITKGQRGTSAKNDDVDVVWQMARKEGNAFTLTAKKRRMGWVPEKVELEMLDDAVLSFGLAAQESMPAGTADVAKRLDELGVPVEESARKARLALRDAGHGARDQVVRAAQKYRRERSSTYHFAGDDNAMRDSGLTASQNLGTRSIIDYRDAARDAGSDSVPNDQVDDLGRGAGRGGTRSPGQLGRSASLSIGTHASSPRSDELEIEDPDPDDDGFVPF